MRAIRRAPQTCVGRVRSVCRVWSSVEEATLSSQLSDTSTDALGQVCSALSFSRRRFGIGSQDQLNSCKRMVGRKLCGIYNFTEHDVTPQKDQPDRRNDLVPPPASAQAHTPPGGHTHGVESDVCDGVAAHVTSSTHDDHPHTTTVGETDHSGATDVGEHTNTSHTSTASVTADEATEVSKTANNDNSNDNNSSAAQDTSAADGTACGVGNAHRSQPSAAETHDTDAEERADETANEAGDGEPDGVHRPTQTSATTAAAPRRTALPPSAVELPESTFLKCIEKEITDEELRLDKEEGPPPTPPGWHMYHTEGTSVIYARRLWQPSEHRAPSRAHTSQEKRGMERHWVRIQLTARDASLDPECDIRGERFPFCLFVQRVRPEEQQAEVLAAAPYASGESSSSSAAAASAVYDEARLQAFFDQEDELSLYRDSVEVRCDVVDGELKVDHVVFHGAHAKAEMVADARDCQGTRSTTAAATAGTSEESVSLSANGEGDVAAVSAATTNSVQTVGSGESRVLYDNPFGGYPGPNLDEAEEDVLDGISSWLAERMIDDQFGEFISQYSVWVEQAEYELWLKGLRDFVAA